MNQAENTELFQGFVVLSKRIKKEKAEKIRKFVGEYLAPIIEQFPELKGRKIQILIRRHGWFANYEPTLQIVVRESALSSAECSIKSTAAHELLHLVQFVNEIGTDKKITYKLRDRQHSLHFHGDLHMIF